MEQAYSLSVWSLYNGLNEKLLLWNQWMDRDKSYFEVTVHKGKIELGKEFRVLNAQLQHLLMSQTHKYDRDKFMELDKAATHTYFCKDKDRLSEFVLQLFEETHLSEQSANCSSSLLAFNKVKDFYVFLYGNRKDHKTYCIQSKVLQNTLGVASYISNYRLVHSKFSNLFFDGIDRLMVRKDDDKEVIFKLQNKTKFAEQFQVEDVMNFPVDDRSAVVKVYE